MGTRHPLPWAACLHWQATKTRPLLALCPASHTPFEKLPTHTHYHHYHQHIRERARAHTHTTAAVATSPHPRTFCLEAAAAAGWTLPIAGHLRAPFARPGPAGT